MTALYITDNTTSQVTWKLRDMRQLVHKLLLDHALYGLAPATLDAALAGDKF